MNKRRFRIFVHKTSQHFYVQLIDKDGSIKAANSTLSIKNKMKKAGDKINVNFVNNKFVKELANDFAVSIKSISIDSTNADVNSFYDRGKKKYCGLVKLFADSLRENGILI
jgi:ribosomal protein L18